MPAFRPRGSVELLLLTMVLAAMPAAAGSEAQDVLAPPSRSVTEVLPDGLASDDGLSIAGLLVRRWSLSGAEATLPVWMDHSSDKRFHDPDQSRAMRMDALRCAAEGSVHGQGRLMHTGNLLRVGF